MASVLVVDDEPAIRDLLALVLEGDGYEVRQASDGEEALVAAERQPPDVILLDIKMPGMSGVEFARRYALAPGPRAPIVIVTAAREVEDTVADVDVCAFLAKPFELQSLLDAVRACVPASRPASA